MTTASQETFTPPRVRKRLAAPSLWHQAGNEVKLGCIKCPELEICGGLGVEAPVFDCMSLCCGSPATCERYACPQNPKKYSKLVSEVGGLELRPYRRQVARTRLLPNYIPFLLDTGSLRGPLPLSTVAISLYSVVEKRTGLAKFQSRDEMLARFKLRKTTRVVLFGTGGDRHVEPFWHCLAPKKTAESLKQLRPALVTTPNFSMHADGPRHDNLVSMARIAACFEELAAVGLPVALHVNGRTPRDFERWTEYLIASPGVCTVAYEMGTMGRSPRRREWHAQQLIALAQNVRRPLTIVIRAGSECLRPLASAFDRVVYLDTSANMKAKYRFAGRCNDGKLSWIASPTAAGEPIDDLFLANVRACWRAARSALARNRAGQGRAMPAQATMRFASESNVSVL